MELGFGKSGGRHCRLSLRDLYPAAAGRRLRLDPQLVAAEKDQQAPLGPRMLDRDPHERLDELAEFDLARNHLRGLDYRPDVQLPDGRADRRDRRRPSRFLAQPRVALVELPQLAERAPAVVAVPRVAEIGVADRLDAVRRVEARGHLMGQRLVLHEAVLACRLNGLLVKTHGIGVSPFEAGNLGRHQGVLVGEKWWGVFGPLTQLLMVRRQEGAPPAL